MVHTKWKDMVGAELTKDYFVELKGFLADELKNNKIIYPSQELWTAVLEQDPDDIKVVIIGQDPYIKPNQAHGYSFSVKPGVRPPPSLLNIFKELKTDIPNVKIDMTNGYLGPWIEQGVFLLNNVLTVEQGISNSHIKKGWEQFTNEIVSKLNSNYSNIVFMLWGDKAQVKEPLIDSKKHLVLKAAHPSPLARGAYFGSRHFSKANQYLSEHGKPTINWNLVME